MSEWRCRNSARANRGHWTPITTEQRKNQRFRLMKGVQDVYDARPCVSGSTHERHQRSNAQRHRCLLHKKHRCATSIVFIRLSHESIRAQQHRTTRPRSLRRSILDTQKRRLNRVNQAVKKILDEETQRRLRGDDSERNRANRPRLIRDLSAPSGRYFLRARPDDRVQMRSHVVASAAHITQRAVQR
jgi:hypothetical protein